MSWTQTLSLNQRAHPVVRTNISNHHPTDIATSVISIEEQLSGWYTLLRRGKQRDQLAFAYQSLSDAVQSLAQIRILSFTVPAIVRFEQIKSLKLGIAGNDMRIAAIVLENGGTLVTRNVRDFKRIPNLQIVDWSV